MMANAEQIISLALVAAQCASVVAVVAKRGWLLKGIVASCAIASVFFLLFTFSGSQADSYLMLRLALVFAFWGIGGTLHVTLFARLGLDDWFAPFLYLPGASLAFTLSGDRLVEDVVISSGAKTIIFGEFSVLMQLVILGYGIGLLASMSYNLFRSRKESAFGASDALVACAGASAGSAMLISSLMMYLPGIFAGLATWSVLIASSQYAPKKVVRKRYELFGPARATDAYLRLSMLGKGILVKANFDGIRTVPEGVERIAICKKCDDAQDKDAKDKLDSDACAKLPRLGNAILLDLQSTSFSDDSLMALAELIDQLEHDTMMIIADVSAEKTTLDHPQRFIPQMRRAILSSAATLLSVPKCEDEKELFKSIASSWKNEHDVSLKRAIRDMLETHGLSCYEFDLPEGDVGIYERARAFDMLAGFGAHDYEVALVTPELPEKRPQDGMEIALVSGEKDALDAIAGELQRLGKRTPAGKVVCIDFSNGLAGGQAEENARTAESALECIIKRASKVAEIEGIRVIVAVDRESLKGQAK